MQPPQGSGYGAQQPQGYGAQQPQGYGAQQPGGYAGQSGPPQYGMSPPPGYGAYGPPQKKGMPGWAWALIICGVLLVLMPVGCIMFLAAVPVVSSNTGAARQAEGEQLMGTARDYTRVEFAKTASAQDAFNAFRMRSAAGEWDGVYYRVDSIGPARPPHDAQITCVPVQHMSDKRGRMDFRWADGGRDITWE